MAPSTAFSVCGPLSPPLRESDSADYAGSAIDLVSASAQLRFLARSSAANADLFWQLRSSSPTTSSASPSSSATSSEPMTASSSSESAITSATAGSGDDVDDFATLPPLKDGYSLVYVHIIRRTDTIPAIELAYRINGATLRRTNRLWSNDSIHARASLLIPVDQCDVPLQFHLRSHSSEVNIAGVPAGAELLGWGAIDAIDGDVEICAVPNTVLGSFPAARRKTETGATQDAVSRASIDSQASTATIESSASAATTATSTSTLSVASSAPSTTSTSSAPSRLSGLRAWTRAFTWSNTAITANNKYMPQNHDRQTWRSSSELQRMPRSSSNSRGNSCSGDMYEMMPDDTL
ncbi:uncharacterized protein V1518DRAFT_413200 [Limtongia smithiae]|uniref:uncharacterized protein n=1 Tax=Limtongia smithiae TaxID=1125753 RepID=UPI0034CD972F